MSTVTDFFDRGWRGAPDRVAFVKGDTSFTFDEAYRRSCGVAHALLNSGLEPASKIGVLAPNDPAAWISILGIWRAGMIWIPLNPASSPSALADLIDAFDCETLIYHSALSDAADDVLGTAEAQVTAIVLDEEKDGRASLDSLTTGMPQTPPSLLVQMDDVVAIFPTGGTTGRPKGVMLTHRSFGVTFAHMMMALHYESAEVPINLAAAPLTHSAGMMTLPTSARGGTVVVIERAEPVAVLDAIERHGVTEVFLPPTVIYRLLEVPGLPDRDLASLKYLIYGAAPMSTDKLRRALDVFGPILTEGYGQIEAFGAIAYLTPREHYAKDRIRDDARLSSCGRPYPLIRVDIRRDGQSLGAGETGEICVRGDLVMKGYYKQPAATAKALRDGWLHTGDIGHLDEDGYLYITDRAKDVVITGGLNVYPTEVEQVIWSHPAVQDCAVVGSPHPDWGEELVAVVELNAGMSVASDELIALCKERLGGYKAPKRVEFSPRLPRSVNGKVLRREVRDSFWRDSGQRI